MCSPVDSYQCSAGWQKLQVCPWKACNFEGYREASTHTILSLVWLELALSPFICSKWCLQKATANGRQPGGGDVQGLGEALLWVSLLWDGGYYLDEDFNCGQVPVASKAGEESYGMPCVQKLWLGHLLISTSAQPIPYCGGHPRTGSLTRVHGHGLHSS